MSISERIRPGIEAAEWVCVEVAKLETSYEAMLQHIVALKKKQDWPVAWLRSDTLGSVVKVQQHYPEDGFVYAPLYTSPQPIQEELETLRQQVKELERDLKFAQDGSNYHYNRTITLLDELTAERDISDKLEKVLAFYADETMYRTHLQGDHESPDMVVPVADDQGDIARAALAELAAMRKGETE